MLPKPDKCCNMRLRKSFNNILKLCPRIRELETSVAIQISGISRVNKKELSMLLMCSETISGQRYIYIPFENVFRRYRNRTPA